MQPHPFWRHLPIIVGIALPFLFILVIVLITYLPSLSVRPSHDFVYAVSENGYGTRYLNTYGVEGERLIMRPTGNDSSMGYTVEHAPRLYHYDLDSDTSRELSLKQAAGYMLVPGPSSPDGYIVEYRYSSSGIFGALGDGDGGNGYFITKDGGHRRLPAMQGQYSYSRGMYEVIGWVK